MANVTVQNAIASRLAAAAHLRQARILSLLGARLRSLRAKANELVRRLARKAAELGMAGLPHLAGIIRGELDELRSALEGVLEEFARTGYEMSREMLVKTIGAQRLLALINRGTMTEAEEPTAGQIVARYQLAGIPLEELETYVKSLIFRPPDAETVSRWLVEKPPGGLSWEERFWRWAVPAQAAFLTQLTQGLAAGENPTQLEQRIRPFADGLFYKSERIARTEAMRVAERANRATAERMGPYLEGLQIVAVMDEWTRPHHAARNGRVFYRGEDGVYRDETGEILPDLPDEPNCRCMTIPVLTMPPELRGRSAAGEAFRTASGGLIPDPASYAEWWEKASPQEQRIAVGAGRYELVRDRLAKLPTPRPPEWIDFIDEKGRLLPPWRLKSESAEEWQRRREAVDAMLTQRKLLWQQVSTMGFRAPLAWIPKPLHGVMAGDLQSLVRLQRELVTAAARRLTPPLAEQKRRQRWQTDLHPAKEVRREIERRLDVLRRQMDEIKPIIAEIESLDVLPGRRREMLAALDNRIADLRREMALEALRLPEKERAAIKRGELTGLDQSMEEKLDQAVGFLGSITSKEVVNDLALGPVNVFKVPPRSRGSYDPNTATVKIAHDHHFETYVHELGHHLEKALRPSVRQRINKQFAEWTKGAEPEWLGKPYRKDEYYLRRTDGGVWPGSNYAGKIRQGTMEPTELVTMTLQSIAMDPVGVVRDCPEVFDLIVDLLRGT